MIELRDTVRMTDFFRRMILKESYKNTDTDFIKNFILDLRDYGVNYTAQKYKITIQITSNGILSAAFRPASNTIIFYISEMFLHGLENITTDDELNLIISLLTGVYVHEDTHKQQFAKYSNFYKNYIPPQMDVWDTLDATLKDHKYFDQGIEAAAYGRQTGAALKARHPNESRDELLARVAINDMESDIGFMVRVYRDPIISQKARKKFFNAMFAELNVRSHF